MWRVGQSFRRGVQGRFVKDPQATGADFRVLLVLRDTCEMHSGKAILTGHPGVVKTGRFINWLFQLSICVFISHDEAPSCRLVSSWIFHDETKLSASIPNCPESTCKFRVFPFSIPNGSEPHIFSAGICAPCSTGSHYKIVGTLSLIYVPIDESEQ